MPIATMSESLVYVHSAEPGSGASADPVRVVENWHNGAHPGVFRFCDEQPCHALNHITAPH